MYEKNKYVNTHTFCISMIHTMKVLLMKTRYNLSGHNLARGARTFIDGDGDILIERYSHMLSKSVMIFVHII